MVCIFLLCYFFSSYKVLAAPILYDAIESIKSNPSSYQIHLYDLLQKDVYCNISSFAVDKIQGNISIDFDYRGGTRAILTDFDEQKSEVHGHYPISILLLGTSDVQITLNFNRDGTAHGEWRNMGYKGGFDILNRYR